MYIQIRGSIKIAIKYRAKREVGEEKKTSLRVHRKLDSQLNLILALKNEKNFEVVDNVVTIDRVTNTYREFQHFE